MSSYEVAQPILNSPYEEPKQYWNIQEGWRLTRQGRRPAGYFSRDPKAPTGDGVYDARGEWRALELVNLVRQRVDEWRTQGYLGFTRASLELLR